MNISITVPVYVCNTMVYPDILYYKRGTMISCSSTGLPTWSQT